MDGGELLNEASFRSSKKRTRQEMAKTRMYVVPTVGQPQDLGPAVLRIFENPPSDRNPEITEAVLFDALLEHCRTSRRQLEELGIPV